MKNILAIVLLSTVSFAYGNESPGIDLGGQPPTVDIKCEVSYQSFPDSERYFYSVIESSPSTCVSSNKIHGMVVAMGLNTTYLRGKVQELPCPVNYISKSTKLTTEVFSETSFKVDMVNHCKFMM